MRSLCSYWWFSILQLDRLWWLYLHMLANIPERRLARSWMSLILSLMSVIPSLIWSDSDFLTGLDWSMIVHSDSWTFLSSESQEPTGPDVGRSFMLKCDKIFDNFHPSEPFIMFGRVIYIIGSLSGPAVYLEWPTLRHLSLMCGPDIWKTQL